VLQPDDLAGVVEGNAIAANGSLSR
jgi:hypothetical protein